MALDVGIIVAGVNLIVGIFVAYFSLISWWRLRGGSLAWVSGTFFICGILYVLHASIEVFGLGDILYAFTAFVVTMLLAFCLVVIDMTIRFMGVNDES